MKRSQVVGRNRVHRGFESQQPVAPHEPEQILMPINFGVTTRKLRFTRTSSRDNLDLEGKASPVHEPYSTLQRAQSGELALDQEFNRKASWKDVGKLENSHDSHQSTRSAVGASDRVLRSSQARVSSEDPKWEIYRDRSPDIVASTLSSVDESCQDCSSPVLLISTNSKEPQQCLVKDDRGKENQDPHGQVDGTSWRSPLPEWYSRKPLQDITNALATGLGDEQQAQPKKKLKKKKVGSVVAPSFPTLAETQTRRKDSNITQPKRSTIATPKQFSNLGKNFR
jgi:hypothetical protein